MSWDVLIYDPSTASAEGRDVYESVCEGEGAPAGVSRRVAEFAAGVKREVRELRDAELDDASRDPQGTYYFVRLPLDFRQDVYDRLVRFARRCGLAVYDPQMDKAPDGRPRTGLGLFPWLR